MEHSLTFSANVQGVLHSVFQACSLHGKSSQNDKQKAQTKLSVHDVSERKKKETKSVSLENQNVIEPC